MERDNLIKKLIRMIGEKFEEGELIKDDIFKSAFYKEKGKVEIIYSNGWCMIDREIKNLRDYLEEELRNVNGLKKWVDESEVNEKIKEFIQDLTNRR